ncbi:uncharacterized protein MONBRDRAFT_30683 [Monosiga brevicollis MX1]|uniref:THAP-type domain-containing protein n=1 Tax=Monosiga brevicollis TaxID=81824 RepID=A9VEP1_MONBE|nr:uncharacterized protein MONBRDRAFT_30683 [Monosiga brevicollis MX1]EDQ84000.1 predicted protein [Monosiga brevicollis MX1]|eukprot:XP_001751188.1 hypothetical protein [Monosiga brevicollis MX1]
MRSRRHHHRAGPDGHHHPDDDADEEAPDAVLATHHDQPDAALLMGPDTQSQPADPEFLAARAAATAAMDQNVALGSVMPPLNQQPLFAPAPRRKGKGGKRSCVCARGAMCMKAHPDCGDVSLPRNEQRARLWLSILNPTIQDADVGMWLKRGKANNARVNKIHFPLNMLTRNAGGKVQARRDALPMADQQWTDVKELDSVGHTLPAHTCICSNPVGACGNVRVVGWARLPNEPMRRQIWLAALIPDPEHRRNFEEHYDRNRHLGCVSHLHFHPSQFKNNGDNTSKKILDPKAIPRYQPYSVSERNLPASDELSIQTFTTPDGTLYATTADPNVMQAVYMAPPGKLTGSLPRVSPFVLIPAGVPFCGAIIHRVL